MMGEHYIFSRPFWPKAETKMKRVLRTATLVMIGLLAAPLAVAAEMQSFWDLKPQQLRVLVAAPQVMVTRTASGLDAYCRCPVVLKPNEIPEPMKKAIIAVEDKRFMDHGGIDFIALGSVLRGGLSRGGSTIPMQLLKNLIFHDLQGRDVLSKLERKRSEIWHAGTFDGAIGKQELLAAYLNQIEFGGREIVGLYRASRHYFRKEPRDLNLYESALLAGMVQAPARFNPLKESTKERAHERARLVLGLMVQQGRIGRSARLERWRAYGKTGTTTGNADAWFIGWSEGRILGIWMGKRRDAPGGVLAGAGAPADLFRRVATSANEMVEYRASREGQRIKPHVTAERRPAPRTKPAVTRLPERKVAQTKEAVRVRPSSEPLQRRFIPQLPPSSSWDSEFWPEGR